MRPRVFEQLIRDIQLRLANPDGKGRDVMLVRSVLDLGGTSIRSHVGRCQHAAVGTQCGFLLRRSGRPPEAPKDWRQEVKPSCACADCRELQKFVLDPVEQSQRFRVRQDLNHHLTVQHSGDSNEQRRR